MRTPRRRFSALLLACVLGSAVATVAAQTVFRSNANLVRVFATVTDRDGRLVTTLTQNDFEIRDDGKAQPIEVFTNTAQPIRLIVMLDVSGSMEGNLPLLRAGAVQLFSRLGEDDVARVGTFGEKVEISPTFTRDAAELRGALPTTISPDAPTPLWRAVDDAITALKEQTEERRVILVFSDGKDSGPISFKQRFVSQAEVIDHARNADVMVYAIGFHSRSRRPPPPGLGPGALGAILASDLPDPGLGEVAVQSGGGYTEIRAGEDLGAAFARVADELHSQYLIGYTPPKRDGKSHKIEVKVKQGGMTPRARKVYVAPKA